jgi:hypothetical protein
MDINYVSVKNIKRKIATLVIFLHTFLFAGQHSTQTEVIHSWASCIGNGSRIDTNTIGHADYR